MTKRLCLLGLVLPVCVASTCTISGDLRFVTSDTLDVAEAEITISETGGGALATVEAIIRLDALTYVTLQDGQAVEVNGEELTRSSSTGEYRGSVATAAQYTVTVREPTLGVQGTAITAPGDFTITSPADGAAVSLSGFTVSWSNVDATQEVEVTISQRLLGEDLTLTLAEGVDTGSITVTAARIADARFGQGVDVTISVTKISELNAISGFESGTLQSRVTQSVTATPGA